jgi:hypothetical protein
MRYEAGFIDLEQEPCNPRQPIRAKVVSFLRYVPLPKAPDLTKRNWSGRRDSNPRPQPWQGCALPLSYTRSRQLAQRDPNLGLYRRRLRFCKTTRRKDRSWLQQTSLPRQTGEKFAHPPLEPFARRILSQSAKGMFRRRQLSPSVHAREVAKTSRWPMSARLLPVSVGSRLNPAIGCRLAEL